MSSQTGIVYKTRTQMVVEVLREKILSGDIKAGDPLRQDALAKEFNVSRIPVREALLQLEAQGLVHFEAHKGATATELSPAKISELFELRAVMECHILTKAIENMQEEDIKTASEILQAFEDAVESGTRVEKWSDLNYAFHEALYKPANRPQTMEMIQSLNTKCDRYIRMQLLFTTGVDKAEAEHHQLLELCQAKNAKAASALLNAHILEAGQAIHDLLVQQQSER